MDKKVIFAKDVSNDRVESDTIEWEFGADEIPVKLTGSGVMSENQIKAMAEELSAAQDKMLADAMATGKPSLWGRLNQWLWPDCSMCAGWRGIAIGTITTTLIAAYLTYG